MVKFITNNVKPTQKFLKKNKNVLILTADKENVTAAMKKEIYHGKMYTFLKLLAFCDTLNIKTEFITKDCNQIGDDIFAIVKKEEINQTLEVLNSYHKYIKFTKEKEQDIQLPYLPSKPNFSDSKRNR